jgi:Tfp pilus assembly protein PilO
MKRINLLISAILLTTAAFAQSKNPTNKKEINDKIKQAQQQLDKLTPEQRKMLEQMGMSTNVPTMPTGVTDAAVKSAVNKEEKQMVFTAHENIKAHTEICINYGGEYGIDYHKWFTDRGIDLV